MAAAFQLHFMAFAVDVIDGRGPSNKMLCQLKPKKAKVIAVYIAAKDVLTALNC